MKFSIQPILENDIVKLIPLQSGDFEKLYAVASDPEVWANHPNKNRFEREVFEKFFEGAVASKGAYLIWDKIQSKIIGSTRFYNFQPSENSIQIGYTFYAVEYWGKGYNHAVKTLMLDYILQFTDKVILHVGAENYRSQAAIKKLNARCVRELEMAYFGEPIRRNFEFEITKSDWLKFKNS
ncbi:MAG: GNAT family N-acetyltransferase [Flavobacteriaceae bacterium]|nr:GNAT family N-acetyltransferase [Flavobacteriaceae bacterium]